MAECEASEFRSWAEIREFLGRQEAVQLVTLLHRTDTLTRCLENKGISCKELIEIQTYALKKVPQQESPRCRNPELKAYFSLPYYIIR